MSLRHPVSVSSHIIETDDVRSPQVRGNRGDKSYQSDLIYEVTSYKSHMTSYRGD